MAAPVHAPSWYAATRKRIDFPALAGDERADVAIVGGGFTGVSAALFLSERGYDVALLESRRIGWGASGRNGGQLIDGFVETGKLEQRAGREAARMAWDMGLESRDIVVERVNTYQIDCDLKFGYLELAMKRREVAGFVKEIDDKRAKGYPHELTLVPRERVRDYVASDRYIGGLHNAGNGHLHPLNLCIGEACAAVDQGARIFEDTHVTKIHHGRQPRVETLHGTVHAGKVILAGNAYLGDTEPRIRDTVIPAGSYIIGTERLSEAVAHGLLPRDSACCDLRSALDYFRLTPDRRLLFGGLCNYSGRVPRSIAASLVPKMLRVFPQLAGTKVDFEWGGNIAISVNRVPQFGRIEGNTYYAQGYSGHGLAPAHLAGKMLADAVAGDSEQFDVFSRVRHYRIPGGRRLANPVLALGMMWYRLRELF
ncbi:MAG: FAD-binding oxidoreductase [Woeseiaceae bacterium]|nr:FAD-binding oxidoreductase [Woeseiaceae bacterium]